MGLDTWDGLDGDQKCPLDLFILRYIKHYTHIYLYIYIKNVTPNFLRVYKFGQVGGPNKRNQKHPLGRFFLNQPKSNIFTKEITCNFYMEFFCKFYRDFYFKIEGDFDVKGFLIKMERDVKLWSASFLKGFLF